MTTITIETLEAKQNELAKLISDFKSNAAVQASFPITVEFPFINIGERYIGAIIDAQGKGYHLILLPGEVTEVNWNDAMKWAEKQGGDLPNRIEQSMLYANSKDEFSEAWYWSDTQHADDDGCAWGQSFFDGNQLDYHKSNSHRARAVRRLVI